jgi:D-amino-acid oxidase
MFIPLTAGRKQMPTSSPRITVLGSGISGLTTAISLLTAGHTVKIVAEKFTPHITSDIAAAFWSPYHVEGYRREWAAFALNHFNQNHLHPDAGVCPVTAHEFFESESDLLAWEQQSWWRTLPTVNYDRLPSQSLPAPFKLGVRYTIPIIRMTDYIPFLMKQFRSLSNSEPIPRHVTALQDLFDESDIVINCSGLGALHLADVRDNGMYPILGQLVRVSPVHCPNMLFISTGSYAAEPLYIVPRCGKDIILGGTTLQDESWTAPKPYWTDRILERCRALLPSLKDAKVLETKVGHRPARHGGLNVSLDTTRGYPKPVIHNYGHGGAGVSLSWGCANHVTQLVSSLT